MTETAIRDWVAAYLGDTPLGATIWLMIGIVGCAGWLRKNLQDCAKVDADQFGQECDNYLKCVEIGIADPKFLNYLALRQEKLYDVQRTRKKWFDWVWSPVIFITFLACSLLLKHESLNLGWLYGPLVLMIGMVLFYISVKLSSRSHAQEKYTFDV